MKLHYYFRSGKVYNQYRVHRKKKTNGKPRMIEKHTIKNRNTSVESDFPTNISYKYEISINKIEQ